MELYNNRQGATIGQVKHTDLSSWNMFQFKAAAQSRLF